MSMNLTCNVLELWQTPTWFTYAVMEAEDHHTRLRMYKWWVTDQNIRVIKTLEDAEFHDSRYKEILGHIEQINEALNDPHLQVDYI